MDPLLVISNAAAGTADEETLERGLAVLRRHGSVEVATTGTLGELDSVLHRAGSRTIVVAGGDGSLHAVVSALHRRHDLDRTTLGLLPLGTGNDFARSVGIPLDIEEAALLVVRGAPSRVDLVVDELGGVVVNSVHVGAGADASRHASGWKHRLGSIGIGGLNLGRLGYPIGALRTAISPPTLRLRVELDGEVVNDLDQPVLMVAAGNGRTVGGGAPLTPDADAADGRLDVMIARAVGPLSRLGYAARLARGSHPDHAGVTYRRAKQVSVSGEAFWCSADGEVDGPERHRTWRVEPAAYSLLLPA
ncbi:diacylglycerol kinase family protein [Nocardioides sp.]|uniref:diacylglycerol/lipid kinase family protein n=1 Tax=Nocardioides sp. TaxID=35761 RepID=UPI0035293856